MNRNRAPLLITGAILFVIAAAFIYFSGYYIDWLWFKSVGFTSVWSTVLFTKIQLFFIVGLLTAAIIASNIFIAFKRRPLYVPTTVEISGVERLRAQIEPIRRLVFIGLILALTYFAGSSGMVFWKEWVLFNNASDFGVKDPQFGIDISFFAFKLPMYQALIGWGISTLILATLASVFIQCMAEFALKYSQIAQLWPLAFKFRYCSV